MRTLYNRVKRSFVRVYFEILTKIHIDDVVVTAMIALAGTAALYISNHLK